MKYPTIPRAALVCVLVGALCGLSGCVEDPIKKGPYLQSVSPDGITICWETQVPCKAAVTYAPAGSTERTVITDDMPRLLHAIRVTGLQPETRYAYQIACKLQPFKLDYWYAVPGPQAWFRTAPLRDTPFRFAVWGDSQQHSDTFGRIVQGIAEWRPDIALSVGDVVDNGWDLSAWDTQFFGPIHDLAMTTPLFQAIGNHEGLSPLFDAYLAQPGNGHWFAVPYGNSIFVVLDSTLPYFPQTPQYEWLLDTVATPEFQAAKFKFVFFHQPPYSEQWDHEGYSGEPGVRAYLVPIFQQAGFHFVFCGHTHAYERGRWPLEGPGQYYIITGGGGGTLDTTDTYDWPQIQFHTSQHHFIIVDVSGDHLTFRAVNIDGDVIDRIEVDQRLD